MLSLNNSHWAKRRTRRGQAIRKHAARIPLGMFVAMLCVTTHANLVEQFARDQIVFISNSEAGGGKAGRIEKELKKIHPETRCLDFLKDWDPTKKFDRVAGKPLIFLIGGGDGTVSFVLGKLAANYSQDEYLAVFYGLGTGCATSRSIGWGGSAPANDSVEEDLQYMMDALEKNDKVGMTPSYKITKLAGATFGPSYSVDTMVDWITTGYYTGIAHEFHRWRESLTYDKAKDKSSIEQWVPGKAEMIREMMKQCKEVNIIVYAFLGLKHTARGIYQQVRCAAQRLWNWGNGMLLVDPFPRRRPTNPKVMMTLPPPKDSSPQGAYALPKNSNLLIAAIPVFGHGTLLFSGMPFTGGLQMGVSNNPFLLGLQGTGFFRMEAHDQKPFKNAFGKDHFQDIILDFKENQKIQVDGEAWDQDPTKIRISRERMHRVLIGPHMNYERYVMKYLTSLLERWIPKPMQAKL